MSGYLAFANWSLSPGNIRVFGNVRLDNEEELARALDGAPERGIALALRAYERWGSGFAAGLVGDFAVVVLDLAHGVVCAARDPFGVRPLAYRRTKQGMAFASDVGVLGGLDGE